jgi:hypothetical protein
MIKKLLADNGQLRDAYQEMAGSSEKFEFSNNQLEHENEELRDRVQFLEACSHFSSLFAQTTLCLMFNNQKIDRHLGALCSKREERTTIHAQTLGCSDRGE